MEKLKLFPISMKVVGFTFVSLQVISLVVLLITTNCCAQAKLLTNFADKENFVEQDELSENNVGSNVYDDLDDYYNEVFDEYAAPRVIDLDAYDFSEEDNDGMSSFLISEEDVDKNYIDDYEKSFHYAFLRSPAMNFDLSRCPDLPIYPAEVKYNLCFAARCGSDSDCQVLGKAPVKQERVCCFNGCVPTCLQKNDLPKAFDWVEDTNAEQLNMRNVNTKLKSLLPPNEEDFTMERIRLGRDCYVTLQEMENLKMFKKFDHVEICTCKNGEVLCQVKMRTSSHHEQA